MTRAVVIINPLSGKGKYEAQIREQAAAAKTLLSALGVNAEFRTTNAKGDAYGFALDAANRGCDFIVAWGGDGTVNEAASALVHRRIPLCIVPAGSGNGLAADLALPFDPMAALTVAVTGAEVTIDAGQVHESLFFNIAGIGVDAVIAARFAERGIRRRGPLGYLQLGVSELLRYRAQSYGIIVGDERTEHRAMLLALANGRQYGNRVCIAPGARLDDGLLEMVIVEELSTIEIARRLPSLFRGTLKAGRGVTMRAVREVHIQAADQIPFHVDGEPHLGPPDLRVVTHPRALTVRVPTGS